MPKYTVTITRLMPQSTTFEVNAFDEKQARELALNNCGDHIFEQSGDRFLVRTFNIAPEPPRGWRDQRGFLLDRGVLAFVVVGSDRDVRNLLFDHHFLELFDAFVRIITFLA